MKQWFLTRRQKRNLIEQERIKEQIDQTKDEFQKEIEGLVGRDSFEQFKQFAFKGQMVQMAIAFILGAAFKNVVGSISDNIIMPGINFLILQTGNDWREIVYTPLEGLTFEIGKFYAAFVDFFIISIILFIVYKKLLEPLIKEKPKPEIKCVEIIECPECMSKINYRCKRCPHCTSAIDLL